MNREQFTRFKRVVKKTALFIIAGILYAVIVRLLGRGIPCIFHEITGLRCPGCGITHSVMSILAFDIAGAIQSNALSVIILLFIIWTFLYTSYHYIKTGIYRLSAGGAIPEIGFLVCFVMWASYGTSSEYNFFNSVYIFAFGYYNVDNY